MARRMRGVAQPTAREMAVSAVWRARRAIVLTVTPVGTAPLAVVSARLSQPQLLVANLVCKASRMSLSRRTERLDPPSHPLHLDLPLRAYSTSQEVIERRFERFRRSVGGEIDVVGRRAVRAVKTSTSRLRWLSLRPDQLSSLLLASFSSFCSHVASSHLRQTSSSGQSSLASRAGPADLSSLSCRQLRTLSGLSSPSTTLLLHPKLSWSRCETQSERALRRVPPSRGCLRRDNVLQRREPN